MAIKASKSETFKGNPDGEIVQFEYSIEKDSIYAKMMYDISYVDCAVGASAEGANFDKCPGHELGHSIVSPNEVCDYPFIYEIPRDEQDLSTSDTGADVCDIGRM